jgi:ribosomal protein S18 acetylase RimI-like enzyme
MKIRTAAATDAKAIEALFTEFVTYLRSIGDPTDYRFSADKYIDDAFGPDPILRGLVAEEQDGLSGYLLFTRAYDSDYVRAFYMVDLYVKDSCRGQGIGKLLMDALTNVARNEHITRLTWSVHKSNGSAIRFYEGLGAHIADDTHAMYLEI